MFLRIPLPSPLTPNFYSIPSSSSLSCSSKTCSDQNPSFTDRSSGFFYSSKSPVPVSLSLSCCGILRSRCTLRFCRASTGNLSPGPDVGGDDDSDQYIQALLLVPGEFAIIRLIDAIAGEEHEECPGQFQFVKNIVRAFGYEVKMVRITDRVVNTYYARIYLRKAADNTHISIDARPSDALNLAERFKAPIYVNKEIVVKDAIKVVYGNWRARSTRMVYDAALDSAPEEPDPLIEELDLVLKMNKAVLEERFEDAVLWRDKLTKLRMPRQEL